MVFPWAPFIQSIQYQRTRDGLQTHDTVVDEIISRKGFLFRSMETQPKVY